MKAKTMTLHLVQSDAPPSVQRPEITPAHNAAGMAAMFKIAKKWQVTNEQLQILLGRPSRATFYNWKRGEVRSVPHDTTIRISLLLGIYKALHILYADPVQANAWIKQPNTAFGGDTVLRRLLAGEMVDFAYIRDYLDGVRGGWS